MKTLIRPLRTLYWSPLGAPARALRLPKVRPLADKSFWDAQVSGLYAARLGGTLSVDTRNQILAMLIRHKGPKVETVLDVGCSGGTLAPVLLRAGVSKYHGIDISEHAIAHARANVVDKRISFEVAAAQEFMPPHSFDLIVLNEMLQYIEFDTVAETVLRYGSHLTDSGLLSISINLHPKGRAIQRRLRTVSRYVGGFLYQEKTSMDVRTRHNRERPAFHTFLIRPRRTQK